MGKLTISMAISIAMWLGHQPRSRGGFEAPLQGWGPDPCPSPVSQKKH
jgi:hypothetical protein